MHTLKIRNLELGAGIPAICIPNIGKTKEDILSLARQYTSMHMDLMEWRADWYEEVENTEKVLDTLSGLRDILGDIPLLFTFRTENEGGVHFMDSPSYAALNKAVAVSGLADLIDVEIFTGDIVVSDIISAIHKGDTKVVGSNHHFDKTPSHDEIISRLRKMQDMGADIPKIAVMPQSKRDVLTLLAATEEMVSTYADRPIITMSMSGMGSISRLAGEVFGSCLTFGSGPMASAPGQLDAAALYMALQIVHQSL